MKTLERGSRWLHTVRHLRASQVTNRIVRTLLPARPRTAAAGRFIRPRSVWTAPVPKHAGLSAQWTYSALNEAHSIAEPAGWLGSHASRLWSYHAHYLDDLAAPPVPGGERRLAELIDRWIAANAPGSKPGWEPYPTSRRIVNWLKWGLAGHELTPRELASLGSQADLLSRSLEFHLYGNHLLANAKALVFAGALLDSGQAQRWLRSGRALLVRELEAQILADGGHEEASPMYHAVVLEDILDLVNLGFATGVFAVDELGEMAGRMLRWLAVLTHPDGRFALFNDAAHDGAASTQALAEYARRLGIAAQEPRPAGIDWLPASGYGRLALRDAVVLVDAGAIGPDHQPGHAHADTLTYELSLFGERLIVDTGTSTYEAGPERDRQRSTTAHNTVSVDGRNSSDTWSAFRVGRRARAELLASHETTDGQVLSARHDGYWTRRQGIVHAREWRLGAQSLVVSDQVTGRGVHDLVASIHCAPSVSVRQLRDCGFELRTARGGRIVHIETDSSGRSSVEATTHHPAFGVTLPSARIVTRLHAEAPCRIETRIAW